MEIVLSKGAAKEYEHLPKNEQAKIRKKLLILQDNSRAGKKLMGELIGIRSLKVWPYRILYEINVRKKQIEIHKIAHRQGVYK